MGPLLITSVPLRLDSGVCRQVYPLQDSLEDGTHLQCLLVALWPPCMWMAPWLPQGRRACKIANFANSFANVVWKCSVLLAPPTDGAGVLTVGGLPIGVELYTGGMQDARIYPSPLNSRSVTTTTTSSPYVTSPLHHILTTTVISSPHIHTLSHPHSHTSPYTPMCPPSPSLILRCHLSHQTAR